MQARPLGSHVRWVLASLLLTGALLAPAAAVATETAPPAGAATLAVTPAAAKQEANSLMGRPKLTKPTTVTLTPSKPEVSLNPARDYVIKVETGAIFTRHVMIVGGHNVVLENAVLQ